MINKSRHQKLIDLRYFDNIIQQQLEQHIPLRYEHLTSPYFYPAIYQSLANELGYYKGTFYSDSKFNTNVFRSAYHFEDYCEIKDELQCLLVDNICNVLDKSYLHYGIRIRFITHNQWMVSYLLEDEPHEITSPLWVYQ